MPASDKKKDAAVLSFPGRKASPPADVPQQILLGSRLREGRKRQKISQQEVADQLGVTRNTVANWELDKSRPEFDMIPEICRLLHLSLPQLFGFDTAPGLSDKEKRIIGNLRQLSPMGLAIAEKMVYTILVEEGKAMDEKLRKEYSFIRQLSDSAAAGQGIEYSDLKPTVVFIRNSGMLEQADVIVPISGHSMDPVYHDGDHVFVEITSDIHPGEDAVCKTSNGPVIKRVSEKKTLYSLNKDYPFGEHYEDDHIEVYGRVLGIVPPSDYASDEEISILQEIYHDDLRKYYREHLLDE